MERNDLSIASFTGLGHGVFHGFELVIPLFIPIWLATFDTSATVLGIVVGAGYALIGLFAPVSGLLADKYGSKKLVLLSIGGMGVAFASLSVLQSIEALAVTLMLWGAAASLYHPSGLSLISRQVDERGKVLALHGAGGNIGMVVLPLAAIILLAFFDWRLVALLLTLPAAACVLIGFVLPIEEGTASDSGAPTGSTSDLVDSLRIVATDTRSLFVGGFVLVFVVQMLYGVYYRGIFTFLPDVLTDLPIFEPISVGEQEIEAGQLAYSGLLLIGVFGQYAGGMFSDRGRPELALLITFVTLLFASALFVPASNAGIVPLLIICTILGFFIYALAPIMQTLVAEYVTADSHGLSFGYIYFGMFGVGALGAAVAGTTLDYGGIASLFAVLAGLMGLALIVAGVLFRRAN